MKNILILCTGNSCRSQIAHAYFENFTDKKNIKVYSAGIETHGVNPNAIATLAEDGIDIGHYTSNNISEYFDINFDFVITVCDNAKENCPFFATTATKYHFNFPDPAKAIGTETEISKQFQIVRDMIKNYCKDFVENNLKSN
jgi:arsenate reductase (thioredoxin)